MSAPTVLNVIAAMLPSGYLGKLLIMIITCIVLSSFDIIERTSKRRLSGLQSHAKLIRSRQDSNLRGQSPIDF